MGVFGRGVAPDRSRAARQRGAAAGARRTDGARYCLENPPTCNHQAQTMSDQILFDKLAYIDKLKSAGISDDQARAHAEAMDAALRDSVATKFDIAELRLATKSDIAELRLEIATLKNELTLRVGGMLAGTIAI